MTRKKLAIIVLSLILLVSLLACGYYGFKTLRRSHQRRVAMATYAKKDYVLAERLLLAYVSQDQNSEPEFVALANIYHEFGNYWMEAQMWNMASSLNPMNDEYRANVLRSAVDSVSYNLLSNLVGQKIKQGANFADDELFLYMIANYRLDHFKDVAALYGKYHDSDPDMFRKSDLGQMAELLATMEETTPGERNVILDRLEKSDTGLLRYEAVYSKLLEEMNSPGEQDPDGPDTTEELLLRLVEANGFAGTPILADYYYSRFRFADVIRVSEPYLKQIDDLKLYLLFLESCVFEKQLDTLRQTVSRLHKRPGSLPFLGNYGEVLVAYLADDSAKLAEMVRQYGKLVTTPLSCYIRLLTVLRNGTFNEIKTAATEFFSMPPMPELVESAVLACMDYMMAQLDNPEKDDTIPEIAELAQIVAGYVEKNEFLTAIIMADQYRKGLAKEADLLAAVQEFPGNVVLRKITAEHLILNGKAQEAMPLIDDLLKTGGDNPDRSLQFLHMLALEQMKRYDEAGTIFMSLVKESQFDSDLLCRYFDFCTEYSRVDELSAMAENLESVQDGKLKQYAPFFRAAAIYEKGRDVTTGEVGEDAVQSALTILKDTPVDDVNFAFYAANQLSRHDWLDDAEAKYQAIAKTFRSPLLIYVNLSEVYKSKGEPEKALEAAKTAYEINRESMLASYIYAQRLAEAGRYEEAVDVLKFPRHAVDYRPEIVGLWADCMRNAIRNSLRDGKYVQAEELCKHLLVIVPDDEFGLDSMEQIREILHPKKDAAQDAAPASAA